MRVSQLRFASEPDCTALVHGPAILAWSETIATTKNSRSVNMLAVGSRFGQYELRRHIGSGAMGDVYLAHDGILRRDVAIKFLAEKLASDPRHKARIKREAQILAALSNPNIATIYEIRDGALVMEFVEGPTLAEVIGRGPLPRIEALKIAGQVANAIEAAHLKSIVHRDLKPGNIKLRQDGSVKVLDFGVAKTLLPSAIKPDDASRTVTVYPDDEIVGTPEYMAPEQLQAQKTDARVDIWAFGIVLYELLTGKRAFTGQTMAALTAAILKSEPDLSALSEPVMLKIIGGCLVKEREQRWQSITDLKKVLALLEHLPSFPSGPNVSLAGDQPLNAIVVTNKQIGREIRLNLERETKRLHATLEHADPFDLEIVFHRILQGYMTCTHYLLADRPSQVIGSNLMFVRRTTDRQRDWCVKLTQEDLRLPNSSLVLKIAFSQGASYYLTERKFRPYYILVDRDTDEARLGLTGRTIKELLLSSTGSPRFPTLQEIEDHVDKYNIDQSCGYAFDRKLGFGIRVTADYGRVYESKAVHGYRSFLTATERQRITGMVNIPILAASRTTGVVDRFLGVYNIDFHGEPILDDEGEELLTLLQSALNSLFEVYLDRLTDLDNNGAD